MNHFEAYIRMALGLPFTYTLDMCWWDFYDAHSRQDLCDCRPRTIAMAEYAWSGDELVDEICTAWGITRERFVRSMAAPKPSPIAHLIYNDELMQHYGETLPNWPKGRGLIIPKWEGKRITAINFHPLHEILRPRVRAAA